MDMKVVQSHRTGGRRSLTEERKRVMLTGRVKKSTLEFLDSLDCSNRGRAIDLIVDAIQDPVALNLLLQGARFSLVNIAS